MAKKNRTVEDDLRSLYRLQYIDSKIDTIKNLRGELPLEIQDISDELVCLETKKTNITDEADALKDSLDGLKNSIKESESLKKKYLKQQDNVRNNREFEAIAKEIEYQNLEVEAFEKRILKTKLSIDQKKTVSDEVLEEINLMKTKLESKESALGEILAETDKEEAILLEFKEKYKKDISERHQDSYNTVKEGSINGLAVVVLERGASAGSNMIIPPQVQLEISNRNKIIVDEYSGVVLVDRELATEEAEKIEKLLNK